MIKFGLIINPISGMGGKVALKGTDGAEVLAEALRRGAVPESAKKAERALAKLTSADIVFLTAAGPMGAELCERLGLKYQVVYTPEMKNDEAAADTAVVYTTSNDTITAAQTIITYSPELLLFAGGDGTARNICEAIGTSQPVLGIPAGVKIQSAVFALDPESAGTIAYQMAMGTQMSIQEREVVDLNEDEYRTGHVSAKLYGSMMVPYEAKYVQGMKESGFSSDEDNLHGAAKYLEKDMLDDVYYAVGSGSCAKCISRVLDLDYELLGIDIIKNKQLVEKDVPEEKLWEYAQTGKLHIIVSPIGGQGFLFGRGNHQFSARILKAVGKKNIQVVSPDTKLVSIRDHTLHVDCGDPEVNESLRGYYNVVCGYGFFHSMKCR